MRLFHLAVILMLSLQLSAQTDTLSVQPKSAFTPDLTAIDSLYREDQFYFSFTYNILTRLPPKLNQNKFSLGLSMGFLRDFPVNQARNKAIAVGLGYSLQNYNYNLKVTDSLGVAQYDYIRSDEYYEKNKLSLSYIDLPIEFRWRTSVPETHKFWRVYTGIKLSYLFYSRSKFTGDGGKTLILNSEDLNPFRLSAYLSAGYNTWNFYASYGLTPIFREGSVEGRKINMSNLSVGLMFYIL